MPNGGAQRFQVGSLIVLACAAAALGLVPRAARAQTCTIEVHDQNGVVPDGSSLCQVASGKICTFNLELCRNPPDCTPSTFKRTTGHCNPGKLKISSSQSPCGNSVPIKVRTKKNGRKQGSCKVRAAAKSNVDKITLLCMPAGSVCPGVTTTTTSPLGTTTTISSATTTQPPTTTTHTTVTTTTIHVVTTTTVTTTSTTAVSGATTTTTAGATTTTAAGATTTTSPGATTTTTLPTGPLSLKFVNTLGTTSCGGAGLSPGASCSPVACSGELDSDAGCTTKTNDLGNGCLYIGGGNGKAIPPGGVPSGAVSYLDISGTNLVASAGTGTLDCSKAAGPAKVCINNDPLPPCTSDANCGGSINACFPVANCFFGPPLEFPNPAITGLTTCVLNVVHFDASGTGDATTGSSSVTLPLASEVYVTGNLSSPCPHCVSGSCTYGANALGPCTTTASSLASQDCPPERGLGAFQAPLGVTLTGLGTGTSILSDAAGNLCPSQKTAGAFGNPTTKCIKQTGSPAGNLTDGQAHAATLAAAFCIPTTNNGTIDLVADLPGPGATSLNGMAQIVPTP